MAGERPSESALIDLRARSQTAVPKIMGILNVTPDSFSDGGAHTSIESAVDHALRMIDEGAEIIDVGPESTRPGSNPVGAQEQIDRAIPVIEALCKRRTGAIVSIDTRLADVARAALKAGALMINDTAALRDDAGLVEVAVEYGAHVVLMHRRGTPATMQQGSGSFYDDVITEVKAFLAERIQFAESRGVAKSRVYIDPGLGFGKRLEDNVNIMRHMDAFTDLGRPVLIGASRKSFLGALTGENDPSQRLAASIACAIRAAACGAAVVRVHDVKETADALTTWSATAT